MYKTKTAWTHPRHFQLPVNDMKKKFQIGNLRKGKIDAKHITILTSSFES